MEKTKIRRSLFIGLGGTGMRTLLYLKKLFFDTYTEVPPMIGFLGVDTDTNEFSDTLESKVSNSAVGSAPEVIRLLADEQVKITVNSPRELYGRQKELFDQWLPKENNRALQSLRQGAGQVRTNGRFAMIANTTRVEKKVREALNKVASVKTVDNPHYELIDSQTDVYVIFSLGGGTGCGTFIDMAYMLRRCAKDCNKLVAYALLPTVFRAQYHTAMDKVLPNGYGAIKDLDWLMSRDWGDKNISLPLENGASWTTNETPFDVCMLIDNKNQNQDVYTENKQLEEMIALSLVTSVGETSKINTSVFDNVSVLAYSGAYDVAHKNAWVTGLGVCEAVVNVEELRKIYAYNVAINLIDQLFQTPEGIDYEVMNWIDSPQVKIREHDADDVIDFLLSKTFPPMPALDKEDYVTAHEVALQYIASQQPSQEKLDEKLEELRSRVGGQLRLFVIKQLNRKSGGGVGAAEAALNTLCTQVQIYLGEMIDEKAKFEKELPAHQNELRSVSTELKNSANSIWASFKSPALRDLAEGVTNSAIRIASIKRGIARREKAISFFNELLVSLKDYTDRVKRIKEKLSNVKTSSISSKAEITSRIDQSTETFQYNLTRRVLNQTETKPGEFLFADFLDGLSGNLIYDFDDRNKLDICNDFVRFAYNLPRARELGRMNVNAVIDTMSADEFGELVRKMVAKSSPLLPCDYHGYQNASPDVSYYIGTKDFKNNRFYRDDYFKKNVRGAVDVTFSNIGMPDRIIIFSQTTPIPPFAISSMDVCETEYNDPNQTTNFHFDRRIQAEMIRTGYSLMPSDNSDNALDLWVRGCIFGMVKNEEGLYKYYDKENGDSLSDYWKELAQDRDEAFKEFKSKIGLLAGQFERKLKSIETDNGRPYVAQILKDAKEHYFEKYSGIGLTKQELLSDKHLKGVADQIRAEIDYLDSKEI